MEGLYPLLGAIAIVALLLGVNWYALRWHDRSPESYRFRLKKGN